MNHLQALTERQEQNQSPGQHIGRFLLNHSNSPEYLVSQLGLYLAAARADHQDELRQLQDLAQNLEFRPQTDQNRPDSPKQIGTGITDS